MIVVLDSGIYISAMEFGGVPKEAVIQAISFDTVVICDQIEEEIVRTMSQKFGHETETIRAWLREYTREALRVKVSGTMARVCRDPKDDFLLECASASGANFLVTGDHDLLSLHSYQSAAIITPRQYLDRSGG